MGRLYKKERSERILNEQLMQINEINDIDQLKFLLAIFSSKDYPTDFNDQQVGMILDALQTKINRFIAPSTQHSPKMRGHGSR